MRVQYTTNNKKEAMYERIEKHGENLNNIFHTGIGNVALCKKLIRLERMANNIAVKYCNEEYPDFDIDSNKIMFKLDEILNYKAQGIPVFFNGDPRGYTLKIEDSWMRGRNLSLQTDWGGYGIIAPDLSED